LPDAFSQASIEARRVRGAHGLDRLRAGVRRCDPEEYGNNDTFAELPE
jgi:hypothetical protein